MSIFTVLVILTVAIVCCHSKSCEIIINKELHDLAPLILNSSSLEFIYPKKGQSSLLLSQGETLDLLCLGASNRLNTTFGTMKNTRIICKDGNFTLPDRTDKFAIKDIKCVKHPQSYAKKNYFDPSIVFPACKNNLHAIGFSATRDKFVQVLQVCFDQRAQSPVISHAIVSPILDSSQRRPRRSIKFNSALVNSRVDQAYKINSQRETFNQIFGSNLTQKYISTKYYLQRGHLMARADFYYQSQQISSYYYLNAVPMWSVINGGNWALLENDVRKFSNSRGEHLHVWTGSFGVLELEDNFKRPHPIFLLDRESLPIPKYLFKLVHEPLTRRAVVFVMINNPFLETLSPRDVICFDVIQEITWANKRPNLSRGLLYACDYHEFKQVFQTVPELRVEGLLK